MHIYLEACLRAILKVSGPGFGAVAYVRFKGLGRLHWTLVQMVISYGSF